MTLLFLSQQECNDALFPLVMQLYDLKVREATDLDKASHSSFLLFIAQPFFSYNQSKMRPTFSQER